LDDIFVDVVWLASWLRRLLLGKPRVRLPLAEQLASAPEKRIAILVPLWREHRVVTNMLAHNVAAIRYRNYDFFVGAYPNDHETVRAVEAAEGRFPNVHLAVCPHDGPTSKADCLNWIYQRLLLFEESHGVRFDVCVTHDAEDLIHPESLKWMNWFAGEYGFIQVPVLALDTPVRELTHGVYCDEFAEFQLRDLPVRNLLGGFVPSAGVGTAYTREALEALAISASNRIFEPSCLTEDYENGYRLKALGFKQLFFPITRRGSFIATREYFPRRLKAAIRQRTRWTTGIALQGWERHGWRGGPRQVYWLWRDRKGLIGNPLSLFTNLCCLYGLVTAVWTRVNPPRYLWAIMSVTLAFQVVRTAVRIGCCSRVYGLGFAALAPVRVVVANLINATATFKALHRYTRARLRGEALVWIKTDHAYPSRAALLAEHRMIGEILVANAYLEQPDLDAALATKPPGVRIGEHLVRLGKITESDLYEALSLQQRLPLVDVVPDRVPRRVARALPAQLAEKWKVLPFRIQSGELHVAATDIPGDRVEMEIRNHTSLDIRFHLITPADFRVLEQQFK
jgi:adsorption protein B